MPNTSKVLELLLPLLMTQNDAVVLEDGFKDGLAFSHKTLTV